MAYTCVTCARRKVKCDKAAPVCSTCRKARLECVYQEPAPRKRKRKHADDVHERLEHYESLLKQNGLLPQDESAKTSPVESIASGQPFPAPKTTYGIRVSESGTGKLVGNPGKSRYIDSNIWKNLEEDGFHPSSDEEEEDAAQTPSVYQSTQRADPVSGALFGPNSPPMSLLDVHPTYESAMKLWKIYVENIDPIVKVVHVPTGLVTVQRAAANPSSAPRATEALLFAIYHFAITATPESECQELFNEPQARLLTRYHDAVRQALVNAYFLRTTDMMVVQAYMLFLLSIRTTYDPHTFWILTGIAVRIAQRLGIHRDGEELGLKPFDVQMRRRIFWQLLPLDGIAGQLCGTGICITQDSWNTRQPLNLNDVDIWPDMTDPPQARTGATEMIFCLARAEFAKFIQKGNPPLGNGARMCEIETINEMDQHITDLEAEMETKYIRYCDIANPLHNLTMGMVRGALTAGRFRTRLPRAKQVKQLPDAERREMWTISTKILDYMLATYKNAGLQRYHWHWKALFMHDPLIWILNGLRRDPLVYQDEPIWSKIEAMYTYNPEMVTKRRALNVATGRLTLKAWDACQSAKPHDEQFARPEPSFITALRTQFERRLSVEPKMEEYNAFAPADTLQDMPLPSHALDTGSSSYYVDVNSMMDFNLDNVDWMFWDQLVRDPTSFPAS